MRARARWLATMILGDSIAIIDHGTLESTGSFIVGADCGFSGTGFKLSGMDFVIAKKQTG